MFVGIKFDLRVLSTMFSLDSVFIIVEQGVHLTPPAHIFGHRLPVPN